MREKVILDLDLDLDLDLETLAVATQPASSHTS
jgi:hypothetical protein